MENEALTDEKRSKEEISRRIYNSISSARAADSAASGADRAPISGISIASPDRKSDAAVKKTPVKPNAGKAAPKKSKGKNGAKAKARRKRKKKNRAGRTVLIILITLTVLVVAGCVIAIALYSNGRAQYDGIFLDNTYVNGVEVSGLTPKEAAEAVRQDSDLPDCITLTRPDMSTVEIDFDDIGGSDNIFESVSDIYASQSHSDWYKAKSAISEFSFTVEFDYDTELLYGEIDRRIVEGSGGTGSENAYIERTDDGFELVEEVTGTKIDPDKAELLYSYIDGFLERGVYAINLSDAACYEEPEVTADDLREQYNKLISLYSVEFVFDFTYTTETLSGSEVIDWITFENDDPTQGYTVDEDKAMEYTEYLADTYDTYGKDRTFESTLRGTITVEQGEGDYGWWIDQEKTCNLIINLIEDGISATVEPYYYENPWSAYTYTCNPDVRTAESDIGDTYCEIDLAEQHFWYYLGGELEYECDIVSGKPTAERNTPAGVYKIWYKERNKTLTGSNSAGETWSSYVDYWNNISTIGVGLHDASWQSSFGGTRYINYGSHGCINMSYAAAKYVYENIDYDTPVIMYW